MFKRFDESPKVARLFEVVTAALAKRRGLPVILGFFLVLVSLVLQFAFVFVRSPIVELLGVIVLHVGILSALLGLALAEALGK
ncbi:MAG: hypothetical protein ACUVSX_01290 [Aggregatilineales bacterium]